MDSFRSILSLVAALALASGQLVSAGAYSEARYCRILDEKISPSEEKWTESAAVLYESVMADMGVRASLSLGWRKRLTESWRAVTFDEPCGPKSLEYVRSIYACRPYKHPTQAFLERDVRKYAQKCLTSDYLEDKFQNVHASGLSLADPERIESFLTSDLLANYRRANPDDPKLHFGKFVRDNCCAPIKAQQVLAAFLDEKFPEKTAKFRATTKKPAKPTKPAKQTAKMHKFLEAHLYKPCVSYRKHIRGFMGLIEAAAHYALNNDLSLLSQGLQDAIFRYKMCKDLKFDEDRARFSELMLKAFQ